MDYCKYAINLVRYRLARLLVLYGIYIVFCLIGSFVFLDFTPSVLIFGDEVIEDIRYGLANIKEYPVNSSVFLLFAIAPHIGSIVWVVPKEPTARYFVVSVISIAVVVVIMTIGSAFQKMG